MMYERMPEVGRTGVEARGEAGRTASGREPPETAVSRWRSVAGHAADRGNQGKATRRIMLET